MKIRKAVRAIIENEAKEFLLVHKVKINAANGKKETISGEWGFVQGGVSVGDKDFHAAMLRELTEETGSNKYEILEQYEDKINFDFPPEIATCIDFTTQETTVFRVKYLGDPNELEPQDDEIDKIAFFDQETMLELLAYESARQFFKDNYLKINR